jgi:hypothetical protein
MPLKKGIRPPSYTGAMKGPGNSARSAALAGALLVSGIFGSAGAQQAGKPESTLNTACRGPYGPLAIGQELYLGASWMTMYGIRVTGLSKQTVTVDLRIPVLVITPKDTISVSFQFEGIPLPRAEIEPVAAVLCSKDSPIAGKIKGVKSQRLQKVLSNPISTADPELGEGLEKALGQLLSIQEGKTTGKVSFAVKSSDEHGFVLKIKRDGRTFRLERVIDCIVEFSGEKTEFVAVPYRIESISVDKEGKAKIEKVLDSSKEIRREELK